MKNIKWDDDIFQLSYFIRSTLGTMTNLIDEMYMNEELTNDKKNGYLDVMRYFIDTIVTKMDVVSSEFVPAKKLVKDRVSDLTFKDIRVMLVDDNEINNMVTEQIFRSYGIEVDVAASGKQAIELFEKNEYDIIFMDYLMPEMNGIDTINAIRNMGERGKKQMFVGLSSYVVEAFQDGLNKLGVELIIMKPVKKEQIGFILMNEFGDRVLYNSENIKYNT